mmetsp:Transcript_30000/g.82313  ORF Transcript_30000/g.82313 Transcript_30000/m.82313 type:complete len:262 (+) Transcript_30000:178-963(+)
MLSSTSGIDNGSLLETQAGTLGRGTSPALTSVPLLSASARNISLSPSACFSSVGMIVSRFCSEILNAFSANRRRVMCCASLLLSTTSSSSVIQVSRMAKLSTVAFALVDCWAISSTICCICATFIASSESSSAWDRPDLGDRGAIAPEMCLSINSLNWSSWRSRLLPFRCSAVAVPMSVVICNKTSWTMSCCCSSVSFCAAICWPSFSMLASIWDHRAAIASSIRLRIPSWTSASTAGSAPVFPGPLLPANFANGTGARSA